MYSIIALRFQPIRSRRMRAGGGGISDSIIALRLQPIRSRRRRWLILNNHLLKMNNHLPLQFNPPPPRISVSWMVCRTICFGCSALPLDLVNLFIAVSLQVETS